jgi:hypothetical protein
MSKYFSVVIGALLWASVANTANATLNCSVGPIGNGLGDVINGQITLHIRDGQSYSWNVIEQSSGNIVTWTAECSGNTGNNPVCPWTYTAGSVNETFNAVQLSGHTSDTCELAITDIAAHVPHTPIPSWVKDGATNKANNDDWWLDQITKFGWLCSVGDAYGIPVCPVVTIVDIAIYHDRENLRDMAKDPPRPDLCYTTPPFNVPSAGDMGLANSWWEWWGQDTYGDGVLPAAFNNLVWYTTLARGWHDYFMFAADAASGCDQLGDTGYFQWQQANTAYGIRQFADAQNNAGQQLENMGLEFYAKWNPVLDWSYPCDVANQAYYDARPDVYNDGYYGPSGPFAMNGAWQHYVEHGQYEGMTYNVTVCPAAMDLGGLLYGPGQNMQDAAAIFVGDY